jgi:hypothetical protein
MKDSPPEAGKPKLVEHWFADRLLASDCTALCRAPWKSVYALIKPPASRSLNRHMALPGYTQISITSEFRCYVNRPFASRQ